MEKVKIGLSPESLEQIKSARIALEPLACEMVSNYLQVGDGRIPKIDGRSFAGLFDKSYFPKVQDNTKALRLWYCLNLTDLNFPSFFLALESLTEIPVDMPEDIINMSAQLVVPNVIAYPETSSVGYADVLSHLKSDLFRQSLGTGNNTISQDMVMKFSANFRNQMRKHSPNDFNPRDPYAKYVVSIFELNQEYFSFISPGPTKVAYLLGYARDHEHYPNFLRPILAGIDNSGKIIEGLAEGVVEKGNSLLQRSTPPPPNS